MKTETVQIERFTVGLEPHEEILWPAGPRTTVVIRTVIIEKFSAMAGPNRAGLIRSVTVRGYRRESGWRMTPQEHTWQGGSVPAVLHDLIREATCPTTPGQRR